MQVQAVTAERARTAACALALAGALAATLALAAPESAQAIGFVEVFTWGFANVLGYALANVAYGLIAFFLLPIADVAFSWSEDYISIPGVGQAILLFQVVALFSVVAIRLAIGVKDNILLGGGSREGSLGEYMFKSLASIALVALMPMMVRTVFYFGHLVFTDVLGGTESITAELNDYFGQQGVFASMVVSENNEELWRTLELNGVQAVIVMVLTALALVVLVVAVGYQFLRRQVEMVVISLIAPLVSIYSATENDSYMVKSLLTRSLGLALTMTIQYVLVRVAIGFAESFMSSFMGTDPTAAFTATFVAALNFQEVAPKFVLAVAALGCALSVPGIVSEFTTPTGNGQAGGMAMNMMRSLVVSKGGAMARSAREGAGAAIGAGKAAAAAGTAAAVGAGPVAAGAKGAAAGIKGAAKAVAGKGGGSQAGGAGAAKAGGAAGTASAGAGAGGASGRAQAAQRIASAAKGAQQAARGGGSAAGGTGGSGGWNSPAGGAQRAATGGGAGAGARPPAAGSAAARPPAAGSQAAGAKRAQSIVADAQRAAGSAGGGKGSDGRNGRR